jgi:hypothetical protein
VMAAGLARLSCVNRIDESRSANGYITCFWSVV